MKQAIGGPADVWRACRAEVEHPPLAALVAAAGNGLGVSDTAERLVPIALGVATVVLLALWAGRRLGRAGGLATGLVAALLPFAVRYSQELRPYPYLIFFAAATLAATDRLLTRPGAGSTALLAAALIGGLYSHDLFPVVLLPAALPLAEMALARDPARRAAGRAALARSALALGIALVAFLPWILNLFRLTHLPPGGSVKPWTLGLALQRWEFLTVAGVEGDRLSWAGGLALALAALGGLFFAGLGSMERRKAGASTAGEPVERRSTGERSAGRAIAGGLILGTVGVELFLLADRHWTSGRYDAVGALFLPVLIGAGVAALWRWRRGRPFAAAALAVLLLGEAAGLARYARIGRPDWDRVARDIRRVERPGEPVLAENEWTRLCLAYYLQGRDFERRLNEESAPKTVAGGPRALERLWPADRDAILVLAATPRNHALRTWAWAYPLLGRYPNSTARTHLLTAQIRAGIGRDSGHAVSPGDPPPAADRDLSVETEPRANGLLLWVEELGRYGR